MMQTKAFPSMGLPFLAAAILLLLPGGAARAGTATAEKLNVPPPGFTALFNGNDFTGWRLSPLGKQSWIIENGVLKTDNPLDQWYDGRVIIDRFEYPEGILSTEPEVIRFQKHIRTEIAGKKRDCPIEYRNIFIKEIEPGTVDVPANHRASAAERHEMLPVPVPGAVSRWKWPPGNRRMLQLTSTQWLP